MGKLLKGLSIGCGALVVIVGSCAGYVGFAARDAKARVTALCDSVHAGQPSAGIAARCAEQGLSTHELPDRAGTTLICLKGVGFARQTCTIKSEAGVVVSVARGFVD